MIAISRGPRLRALGIVLYGPEGIGKTTLASQFPKPVFIDLEKGTDTMDVFRTEAPETFEDFLRLLDAIELEQDFDSVVIDTADKLEQLIIEYVCSKHNLKSIEDANYGKGYTYIAEEMVCFLKKCGEVIECGKNVIIVAHAQMRKFEQPDALGAYDRWELKLTKKSAPIVKEWADMVLFLNYKTIVVTDEKTKSHKGKGGKRVIYTTHNPAWDAKNRFGLPEEMDMNETDELFACFARVEKKESPIDYIKKIFSEQKISEEDLIAYIRKKNPKLREDAVSLETLPPAFIKTIKENTDKIINSIKEEENNG